MERQGPPDDLDLEEQVKHYRDLLNSRKVAVGEIKTALASSNSARRELSKEADQYLDHIQRHREVSSALSRPAAPRPPARVVARPPAKALTTEDPLARRAGESEHIYVKRLLGQAPSVP